MQAFLDRLGPGPDTRILDIGGTAEFWAGSPLDVTVVNVKPPPSDAGGVNYVQADATDLPYEDGSFEIVFSNSMIEHLHTRENQRAVAAEARRVGRSLWIQTPNKWFPIEPHFLTPFIHWLPRGARRRLVRRFTVWGWIARPSREYAEGIVDELVLLSAADVRELFPDCDLVRERALGLTKSLIAVRDGA